jgi:uncharacterized protein
MSALFADTFYWIALVDFSDSAHRRALSLTATRLDSQLITTDEVLVECLNYFSSGDTQLRLKTMAAVRRILQAPGVRVIPQSRESFLMGLSLYEARPDKGYSLVDCISMQTMRREGLTEALTNDRHFEQEGFQALFRDS